MIFCYNNDEFAIIPLGRLAVDIRDILSQEAGSEYEIDILKKVAKMLATFFSIIKIAISVEIRRIITKDTNCDHLF